MPLDSIRSVLESAPDVGDVSQDPATWALCKLVVQLVGRVETLEQLLTDRK